MQKNVLDYLDFTVQRYPDKVAFDDDTEMLTFLQLKNQVEAIGTRLIGLSENNKPIAVYLKKGCKCISSFLGVAASGNFYCPIDYDMPIERINTILSVLRPVAIITDEKCKKRTESWDCSTEIILFEDAVACDIDKEKLQRVREASIDTDPLYVLFTSGSTGVPKGVVICHKAVIDYIDWVSDTFSITSDDIFANQAPFYFDNSILDIYSSLKTGATVVIIPRRKLIFPGELMKYLNEKKITIVFWVPSLLINIANLKVLENEKPIYLKKVLFCGEVMPNKQLNIWRKALPDLLYANLYGPTEITDVCTYYIIDRKFEDDESLPIGIPCRNTRIVLLNEQNELVKDDEEGELCVIGTSLALGYYGNDEKTKEVFVQNPLNAFYRELIYRTGDIVKYNDRGEIIYLCRKDFQIKHMGHRIELGEIETAFMGVEGVDNCACIYDSDESKIKMCYTGSVLDTEGLSHYMKQKVPTYMLPEEYIHYDQFPYNTNGKIDRKILTRDNAHS